MSTLLVDLGGSRLKSGLLPAWDQVVATVHGGQWLAALRQVLVEHRPDELALCVPGVVTDGVVTALPGKLDGIVGADGRTFEAEACAAALVAATGAADVPEGRWPGQSVRVRAAERGPAAALAVLLRARVAA